MRETKRGEIERKELAKAVARGTLGLLVVAVGDHRRELVGWSPLHREERE